MGDVIGFPALAATSMEQGGRAAYHAFGEPVGVVDDDLQPIGIYAIPELSFVGRTEDQLTASNVPFEVGVARYRELARGAIAGRLVRPAQTSRTRGGTDPARCTCLRQATPPELVHIRQTVMVWAAPSTIWSTRCSTIRRLPRAAKVAALGAVNKMQAIRRVGHEGSSENSMLGRAPA